MKKISPELDQDLCAFICGWDAYEKTRGNPDDIIDMNLIDRVEPKSYAFRYDILCDIEKFLAEDEIKTHPQIFPKMNAHHYYLRRTMGEIIPFAEYRLNTMGVKPIMMSEKKIAGLRDKAGALLEPFGIDIGEGMSKKLQDSDRKMPKEEIGPFWMKQHEMFFAAINPFLSLTPSFTVNCSEIDENVGKIAEIRGDGRTYDVTFNLFHMKNYGETGLKLLSAHEITGHAVQFSQERNHAEQGEMPRYMSYLTTHDPTLFIAEGLAETIQYFFPEQFDQSPIMQTTLAVHRLKRAVMNNAQTIVNEGASFKDCVAYVHSNAPDDPKNRMANKLEVYANKPLGSSYATVYGQAMETFIEISGSHPDKHAFVRSVYNDHLLPSDVLPQTRRSVCDFV